MLDITLLPETITSVLTINSVDADFLEGFNMGRDFALSDMNHQRAPQTEEEVWAFIHATASPQVVERERTLDHAHGYTLPTVPLSMRAGSLVGYLMTAFAQRKDISHE